MQKKCFRWVECRSSKCIRLSSCRLRIHCTVKLKETESFDTKLPTLKLHIFYRIQIKVTDFKKNHLKYVFNFWQIRQFHNSKLNAQATPLFSLLQVASVTLKFDFKILQCYYVNGKEILFPF